MVLYINRNTRTTKGYFIVGEITKDKKGYTHDKDKKGYTHDKDKKYPVKMEHNKIIPTKPIKDEKLKKRN
ncbi:hypothetical protein Y001_01885 [Staphylococcus aureus MUF256]|nr:hypothetical protein Y001_01885 [Staphylococcus aureus MUF256]